MARYVLVLGIVLFALIEVCSILVPVLVKVHSFVAAFPAN